MHTNILRRIYIGLVRLSHIILGKHWNDFNFQIDWKLANCLVFWEWAGLTYALLGIVS